MLKFLAKLTEWLLKNSVQKVLTGAGLSVVSYLSVVAVIRAAFESLINSVYSVSADLLNFMGICGLDYALSGFVSVAVFLMTIKQGSLSLRKK
ncbi:hypothetical protein B9Y25_08720 [Acinetobacter baumannii]|uniref:DUF2523 family protein n=1 Tax=Acinetobacter baumannii TaxID=470 RepID=UPI0003DF45CC|nr:DUF2523 family protein [Acinetobacter baumannii]ETQ75704.1 PF10734 family protein [Acinetobacter baumannii UH5107]KHV81905.1 hypothetical protein RR14_15660 [Acinetobacter baumannii]KHW65573.1 hypothetical protein RQ87_18195 [Acinetobacter baumannii]KHW67729.1 hypothetical protein RQ86_18335 [Acinetobacter baumannii]KHW74583.1 hypothetical protein RQ84_18410 [Acinetobacter baumannii]